MSAPTTNPVPPPPSNIANFVGPKFPSQQLTPATAVVFKTFLGDVNIWDKDFNGSFNRTGDNSVERLFLCALTDVYKLVNTLFNGGIIQPQIGSSGNVGYAQPWACPYAPQLYAQEFKLKLVPVGDGTPNDSGGLGQTEYLDINGNPVFMVGSTVAECTLIYGSPPYSMSNANGEDLEVDISEESIQAPGTTPVFSFMANDNSGTKWVNPSDAPPIRYTIGIFRTTLRYQPKLPLQAFVTAMASPVNSVGLTLTTASQTITLAAGKGIFFIGSDATHWKTLLKGA